MIPSARDYLTMWYQTWLNDLGKNLEQQGKLKDDEASLRELVATCEAAFGLLFPAPAPAEPPVEAPPADPVPVDPV